MKVQLQHVAHTRSGDKSDTSNIAVFAYEPEFYPLLKAQLTAERFKAFYGEAIKGEVIRYEAPNIEALNFVCHGALGGGVSRSRRRCSVSRSRCRTNCGPSCMGSTCWAHKPERTSQGDTP